MELKFLLSAIFLLVTSVLVIAVATTQKAHTAHAAFVPDVQIPPLSDLEQKYGN